MVTFYKTYFGGMVDGEARLHKEGHCLSTDEKPTGGDLYNGSQLVEIDTGKTCYYDMENETWHGSEEVSTNE